VCACVCVLWVFLFCDIIIRSIISQVTLEYYLTLNPFCEIILRKNG